MNKSREDERGTLMVENYHEWKFEALGWDFFYPMECFECKSIFTVIQKTIFEKITYWELRYKWNSNSSLSKWIFDYIFFPSKQSLKGKSSHLNSQCVLFISHLYYYMQLYVIQHYISMYYSLFVCFIYLRPQALIEAYALSM